MDRYFNILKGAPSRHILLKSIGVAPDFRSLDDKGLWRLHDEKIAEYRELDRHYADYKVFPGRKSPSLLDVKAELAARIMERCYFCEIRCGANRYKHPGACGVDASSHYYSEFLHFGEEPELVPSHAIFFEGCTFACAYCQNWTIATEIRGNIVDPKEMARLIETRHKEGGRNVNFVGGDPTPHLHTILEIIKHINSNIPTVWNSNMYITPESMKLLEGTVDVFLGDFRYGDDEHASRYSSGANYWAVTTRAFLEAKAQADVLVRQLVLPGHIECCTKPIVEWCAQNLGKNVRFNLMFQYYPEYRASMFPEIDRMLTGAEIRRAMEIVKEAGLTNLVERSAFKVKI
jgi:putative pyruvate formate lyase activating enzyme